MDQPITEGIYEALEDMNWVDESCRKGQLIAVARVFEDGSFHYMGLSGSVWAAGPDFKTKLKRKE